jgi:arylsulfatase A-like enzyme
MNFHRGFHAYRWVRGQECDPYESGPARRKLDEYVNDNYPAIWRGRIAQFLANTDTFTRREDWFAPQVVEKACDWLERSRSHKNFFLWLDSFDLHEPWDPPKQFDRYTDPAYRGRRLVMPMGGPAKNWAKDDSLILLLADHGHPLADHGKFLKGADRLYNELLCVPFLLRLPGGRRGGTRVHAMVEYHDVLPTLLDLMGLENETHDMHGRSFRAIVEGDASTHRELCITGYHAGADRVIRWHPGRRPTAHDAESRHQWSLILRPEGEPDELYDLIADPR